MLAAAVRITAFYDNPVVPIYFNNLKNLIITVGNDARKLVADGYPLEQVLTSDIRRGVPIYIVFHLKIIGRGEN